MRISESVISQSAETSSPPLPHFGILRSVEVP